jgi:hypothetical protein
MEDRIAATLDVVALECDDVIVGSYPAGDGVEIVLRALTDDALGRAVARLRRELAAAGVDA